MGISLKNLTIMPKTFSNDSSTPARIQFEGFVDDSSDNPVDLIFSIEDIAPVFIKVGANKSKSIKFQKNFKVATNGIYSEDVTIMVEKHNDPGNTAGIFIDGKTQTNDTDSSTSTLKYD